MKRIALFSFFCLSATNVMLTAHAQQHRTQVRVSQSSAPIVFAPASAKADPAIDFTGRLPGLSVAFRPSSILIGLDGERKDSVEINFSGAASITPRGDQILPSYSNYLLGNDPGKWQTHVPNYARVVYPDLYSGITAIFYGNGQHLEHDFLVAPGADPTQIHLHFSPNARPVLRRDGSLSLSLASGSLRLQRPTLYQTIAGRRVSRKGSFRLVADGDITFGIGRYDHRFPLTIDPVLDFAT